MYPFTSEIVSKLVELSIKYWGFIGPTLFTEETVIGNGGFEFGTMARFIEPFGWKAGELYGPLIPGPDKKNPNTSLYWVFSHPKYSCDPKTYLKETVSLLGIKSNSKFTILVKDSQGKFQKIDGSQLKSKNDNTISMLNNSGTSGSKTIVYQRQVVQTNIAVPV